MVNQEDDVHSCFDGNSCSVSGPHNWVELVPLGKGSSLEWEEIWDIECYTESLGSYIQFFELHTGRNKTYELFGNCVEKNGENKCRYVFRKSLF